MRWFALVTATILLTISCAEFNPSGEIRPVLFESDRDGSRDIFEIDLHGNVRNRTDTAPLNEEDPSQSPVDDRFAFIEAGGLYVSDIPGLIYGPAADPAWDPDGQWIAFSDGTFIIQAIRPDGSDLFLIADVGPRQGGGPSWSPDGQRIVFTVLGPPDEIWIADVFGPNLPEALIVYPGWSARSPAWAPGRDLIAFCSDRSGDYEIYVAKSNGEDERRLTFDPVWADTEPVWSPDGTRIVWQKGPALIGEQIWIMDASGENQQLLEDDPGSEDQNPTW